MPKECLEISIFGELADFYRASLESDVPTEAEFTFSHVDQKKEDFDQLANLIEQGKITMEDFFYLYALSNGLMMRQIEGKEMDRKSKDSLARDLKMRVIGTIMDSKDQQQDSEIDTIILGNLFELLTTEESFILKVIECAFNDAEVTKIMDRLKIEVEETLLN